MKRQILNIIASLLLLSFATGARAQGTEKQNGLGFMLGAPTALSGKFYKNSKQAIDVGVALNFNDYFMIFGDYLLHYPGAFGKGNKFLTQVTPYFGVGGLFAVSTSDGSSDRDFRGRKTGTIGLGVRVPFGAEWRPGDPSIGVFAELAPGISIIPQTTGIFQGSIGIRYYF